MRGDGSPPLRIGINALYLIPGRVGGTEIYLRNVLQALAAADRVNEYFVFRNRETGPDLVPDSRNFHDSPRPVKGASRPARILYEQLALPFVCSRLRLDVLFNAGFTAPLFCACPMVTVFHDLQYIRHPEYFRWFDLPFWRVLLPLSAARSRRLVALSGAVKSDLERFYRFPASRIDVVPHGVEPEFQRIAQRRQSAPPRRKLLLSVSTLHPHKNVDSLLKAFSRFPGRQEGWELFLVGLKGFETVKIERLRTELALGSAVTLTGWIPRHDVYRLFEEASAFIYPSRFEGFGIPVLEALTAGLPTACSELPSLREIAGDAARFFEPDDVDDIAAAMTEITNDREVRTQLRGAGPLRALHFGWPQSAERLVSVLRNAVQPEIRSKNFHD